YNRESATTFFANDAAVRALRGDSRRDAAHRRLRGLHRHRFDVDTTSRLSHVRPRGLLRRLATGACAATFQYDGPPDDRVARARRYVGLVLRPSALLRSDARGA